MRTVIDHKVVEMKFDSEQFKKNVESTMTSLDKLKEKLKLNGASQGLENIKSLAERINLGGLTTAVESIRTKFGVLEIVGITALTNIANSAINAGKRMVSALTIDPIKMGFSEYETQMNAVQTILANTESKGTTLQDVNRALDELNLYADKTIYNFTEMTKNIGTFTAAGIDLNTSVSAIQGIANLAAVSGSTSQQASTAMYQLSQALSSGTVKLMDWNSVVNAGMGGQVFQDALKETARVHGVKVDEIIKKEGSFRESLSHGWITSDILTKTLEKFTMAAVEGSEEWETYKKSLMEEGYTAKQADEILKMANTATDAATKVKTFTQLWSTLQESAQSGWTNTWEIIVGDFGEAKEFLTAISDRIGAMLGASADARNQLLSGGLSTGWKQLLGAGIADEEGFKETLFNVTKEAGFEFDKLIKETEKNGGNFNDALKKALNDGSITSDMLSESVSKLSAKMQGMSAKEREAAGYTKEHVKQIKDLEKALKDGTLSMDDFVKKMGRSSGRENLIESLTNTFNGLMNIVEPIKEAFRDIFPAMTSEELYNITVRIKEMTLRFANFTEKYGPQIKSTFKGIFAVLDIGVTIFKKITSGVISLASNLLGLTGYLLKGTGAIGDWLTGVRNSTKSANMFGRAIDGIVGFLQNGIDKLKEFGRTIKANFKADGYEGIYGFFKALCELVIKVGGAVAKALGGVGKTIAGIFNEGAFGDALATGTIAGFFAVLIKLVNGLNKPLKSMGEIFEQVAGKDGVLENVKGILTDVRGCFEQYQQKLKADILIKIAGAIGILAAAIWVISTIDPEKLGKSLSSITILFVELMTSLYAFSELSSGMKGALKASIFMISISNSMLILAAAMKIIGSMKPGQMISSLVGIAGGLTALIVAVSKMPENDVRIAAKSIRSLSISMVILGAAMKIMASMSWNELGRGITGTVAGLAGMVGAINLLPTDTSDRIKGLMRFSTALIILAGAMKIMGSMSWSEIGRGLTVFASSLAGIIIGIRLLPNDTKSRTAGLLGMSIAMLILGKAIQNMGSMDWSSIGKGLTVLGGSMLILAVGLNAMKSTLAGAASLLVASQGLLILAGVLKIMGNMSWGEIGKSLITLAGAFTVMGVAGALLSPIIPAILGLAGAAALFGVAALAIGGGLTLIGLGISAISGALAVGATAIVAGLNIIIVGILDLIPTIGAKLAEGIVAIAKVLGQCAPQLAESLLKLVYETLVALAKYTPLIAGTLFDFLIGILDVVAERMPELIVATVKVIAAFFEGVANALKGIDGTNFIKGIVATGLLAGLMFALSAVAGLIPSAMVGVLGIGIVIAELALVLAAIGGLAQIPGLQWIISEGGDLLQAVGTAIGQFIGGLIGGIARGVTNSLPDIATNLSDFMTNIQPFIEGAKSINKSIVGSIGSLVSAILMVTGADVISSITSFFTGKDSLSDFSDRLVELGKGIVKYGNVVKGVDTTSIVASANAAKALSDVAAALPNQGGLADVFAGKNDLGTFAENLVPFATSLKEYAEEVAGLDSTAIQSSASAAKALAEMTAIIPNEGGMVAWFTGNNSVAAFGKDLKHLGTGLKEFATETADIIPENIKAASSAAKALAEMTAVIPNEGGMVAWFTGNNSVSQFAGNLKPLGTGLKDFAKETEGIIPDNIKAAADAAKSLAEMTKFIPNEGGMVAWFTGDNSMSKFAANLKPLGTGLKDFSTETADIVPDAVVAAANAAKALAEMTEVIPNSGGVVSWFAGDNSVAKFASNLKPLGTGLKEFSKETADISPENITAAANSAKALAEMTAIIPNEGGIKAWFSGDSSVSTFASNLKPLGTGIKGFADAINGIDPEQVKAGATAAKTLAQMAETAPKKTDKIIDFGTNLISFGSKLKSYFTTTKDITPESIQIANDAITSINKASADINGNNVGAAGKAIKEFVKSIKDMKKISDKTVSGFSKAMTTLSNTNISAIAKSFSDAGPKMKDAGSNIIKKLEDGIKSREKNIKDALKKITSAVSDNIKNIKEYNNSFSSAGSYLVDGFCNGIDKNTYKVKAKAKAMADAAKIAAEKALGIRSPSRVFYKIGGFTGEGFINALTDSAKRVYNAGSAMGDSATKGMNSAISKISDIINSDIDSQPVIRPVLDLSDVETGAGSIGGMFNNMRVRANLNAISQGVNSRLQNGVNDDVISAINNLRNDLSNLGGNTYNVNGITYDDGSNITNAVKELIRAAKVERRV